jgi:hypothetical protein
MGQLPLYFVDPAFPGLTGKRKRGVNLGFASPSDRLIPEAFAEGSKVTEDDADIVSMLGSRERRVCTRQALLQSEREQVHRHSFIDRSICVRAAILIKDVRRVKGASDAVTLR